jgi:hypothetical protein
MLVGYISFLYMLIMLTRQRHVICFPLGNFPASEFYMPMFQNTLSVPKRRHIKFRRQGITQKKTYNI